MGGFITFAIFLAIGFVTWITNTMREAELKRKRDERRRERGLGSVEEDFVDASEVQVMQSPRRQPARQRDDVWREQNTRQRRSPKKKSAAPPAPAPRPKSPPPQPSTDRLSDRHLQSDISSNVVRSGIGTQIERDLPHMSDSIGSRKLEASGLGDQARLETTSHRATPAGALRRMLASPQGVRNAFMMAEILSPPLAARE